MAMGWAIAFVASLSGVVVVSSLAEVNSASTPATQDVSTQIWPMLFSEPRSPLIVPASPPASIVVPTLPGPAQFPPPSTPYLSFNSKQLDRQIQRYADYLHQFGPPDILLVGSSRSLQGIDPIRLQEALSQQGYPGLKVFNFGINGATAQVVDWLLQRLLPPDQLPKLIIWADGSRAFNHGRVDQTYHNIITSAGHRQLVAGLRPPKSQNTKVELGRICLDLWPVPTLPQAKSMEKAVELAEVSQGEVTRRSPCRQPFKIVLQNGLTNSSASPQSAEAAGLQIVTTRFSPTLYFRRFPKVNAFYDADYQNFTLVGKQTEAFGRVLAFVNAQRIPLVFVNLPLTNSYLEDGRAPFEQRFRSHMRRLAAPNQFLFKDLTLDPTLRQDQYFADPSHLNRFGATAVANSISRDLLAHLSQMERPKTRPWQGKPSESRDR